jgi:hypothetical protein
MQSCGYAHYLRLGIFGGVSIIHPRDLGSNLGIEKKFLILYRLCLHWIRNLSCRMLTLEHHMYIGK